MSSNNEDEARDSNFGLYRWLVYSAKAGLASPSNDLIAELFNKVAFRRQPALISAISQSSQLLNELPELVTNKFVLQLRVGLEYLLTETELPSEEERARSTFTQTTIKIEDRPAYRTQSAILSRSLFNCLESGGEEIPEILIKWREMAASDSLPEVRQAWNDFAEG
jgi:hypothetical protein